MAKSVTMKVAKCPDESLALLNCLVVNPADFKENVKYVTMTHQAAKGPFTFNIYRDARVPAKQVGVTSQHRRWALLALSMDVNISEFIPDSKCYLAKITLEIDTLLKGKVVEEKLKGEDIAKHFLQQYSGRIFTTEELLAFEFHGVNFSAKVNEVLTVDPAAIARGEAIPAPSKFASDGSYQKGILKPDLTQISFVKAQDSKLKLEGSQVTASPIISPDFKFEDMGIGGLDEEFKQIFRRAFASRIFPPQVVQQLGIKHVKGMLLYGPPGTGKTLMARQIGKLLKAREPKIVNGPEVLNKYVGQTEENIRKLFEDAEIEYKQKGDESSLHMIIFDEIDAICKQRGSRNDGTGVGDSVVNQLLSKLDGVEQLHNILVIGMTNRKDLIDDALLRPGRLEVHIEIGLPNELGRYQILKIHTEEARKNSRLADDVDLLELAQLTKNFSGAEIQGLVNSAASFTMNRHISADSVARPKDDLSSLKITRNDFLTALKEIIPAFGYSDEEFKGFAPNGIISYSPRVDDLLADGRLYIRQSKLSERTPLVSLLLHGPPGTGKTAIAATLALESEFPYIKFITPERLVAYSESTKCSMITKVFEDAYKSSFSVIVVDAIERLLEFVPIGPRFSNTILQTLTVLMNRNPPPGKRLLIIATTSQRDILDTMGMMDVFSGEIRIPTIQDFDSVRKVTQETGLFTPEEELRAFELMRMAQMESRFAVGIKRLLNIIEKSRQDTRKVDKFFEGLQLLSSL